MYKFTVFAPKDDKVIETIIAAAASAGAGVVGTYTHCAFITEGVGVWKPEKGSKPTTGNIGTLSKEQEVKIEMECEKTDMQYVFDAIRKVHPYDKIAIDAVEIVRFE